MAFRGQENWICNAVFGTWVFTRLQTTTEAVRSRTQCSWKVQVTGVASEILCFPDGIKKTCSHSNEMNTNGAVSSCIQPLFWAVDTFPHQKNPVSTSDLSVLKLISLHHQWGQCREHCRRPLEMEQQLFHEHPAKSELVQLRTDITWICLFCFSRALGYIMEAARGKALVVEIAIDSFIRVVKPLWWVSDCVDLGGLLWEHVCLYVHTCEYVHICIHEMTWKWKE